MSKKRNLDSFTAGSECDDTPRDAVFDAKIEQLREEGYTVIENVITPEKCAEYLASIYSYLQNCGIDATDDDLRQSAYPNLHGIIQQLEVGHSNGVWGVRQDENVIEIFQKFYGTNDMLGSFDGLCVMPKRYRDSGKTWWHTDQSHQKPGLRCIQGYINLTDASDERTGSLVVIPGSHKYHTHFATLFPEAAANKKDWFKFTTHQHLTALGGAPPKRVHGGIGSLVLWDSRTAHQASPPPRSVNEARVRCIVYVCYQPRSYITARNLAKKQKAFDEYRMTTHWPASKIELFSKTWRTYGQPIAANLRTPTRDRVETARMLELAGKTALTTRPLRRTPPMLAFVN